MYTFLSYEYAVHVKEGVKASDVHAGHCHTHVPQVHENQLFNAYQELEKLAAQSDRFDEAAFQKVFVDQVCNQLILCEQSRGTVASDSNNATTHQCFPLTWLLKGSPTRHQRLVVILSAVPAEVRSSSTIS